MNADALPLDLLAWLALSAWFVYALVIASETPWNRHITERTTNGLADDPVQSHEGEHARDDPANDRNEAEEERTTIHSRIVARGVE